MCERCGGFINTPFSGEERFLLGLFSLLEAVLDMGMEDILKHLSFSGKMRAAMVGEDRDFNRIMEWVTRLEKGQWSHKTLCLIKGTTLEQALLDVYLL